MALTLPIVTEFGPSRTTFIFSGRRIQASPLSLVSSAANSKRTIIEGFDSAVYAFGSATAFVLDVYVSPDGGNFIKLGSITEATVIKRLDLGMAHSVLLDLVSVTGGGLSAAIYGEERKR